MTSFVIWLSLFTILLTDAASVKKKPGCLFENKFFEVGSIFSNELCDQKCSCLGTSGLYMYICQPLCSQYSSECVGKALRYNKIQPGLPYYNCTCIEAVCDVSVKEPFEY